MTAALIPLRRPMGRPSRERLADLEDRAALERIDRLAQRDAVLRLLDRAEPWVRRNALWAQEVGPLAWQVQANIEAVHRRIREVLAEDGPEGEAA